MVPTRFLWIPHEAQMSMKNSASTFRAQVHWNALCDPRIQLDAKQKFDVMSLGALFMDTTLGPP
jgi:hypothetical protein